METEGQNYAVSATFLNFIMLKGSQREGDQGMPQIRQRPQEILIRLRYSTGLRRQR
jgi:hypothetical protein